MITPRSNRPYTAQQRLVLSEVAWDHVSSVLDGRESDFDLHAGTGIPALRRCLNFEGYNLIWAQP